VATTDIAHALEAFFGRRVGAHTLRRSALHTAIQAGVPLAQAMLLSLHRTMAGAVAYTLEPDIPTRAAMAEVSRHLG
jgi:uncharacterized membrane protein YdfJ with MMPL/SSD domain